MKISSFVKLRSGFAVSESNTLTGNMYTPQHDSFQSWNSVNNLYTLEYMYTIRVHVLCTHVRSHVHDLKYTEWKIHEKSTRFEKRFTTRNRVLEYAVPWYSGKNGWKVHVGATCVVSLKLGQRRMSPSADTPTRKSTQKSWSEWCRKRVCLYTTNDDAFKHGAKTLKGCDWFFKLIYCIPSSML